jgi:hypothetical protein
VLTLACGSKSSPVAATAPIIPNFAGTWNGRLTADRCSDTTVLGVCATLRDTSLALTIAQTATQLTATMIVGNGIAGSTSGTAGSDGSASLSGYTYTDEGPGGRALVWRISSIALRLSGNTLSGTMHTNVTGVGGLTGAIDIDHRFSDVTR